MIFTRCDALLIRSGWFAERVFASLGPVADKSDTDEEIAFFLPPIPEHFMRALEVVGCLGLGFLVLKAAGSALVPFLLQEPIPSWVQVFGWQHCCCIQTEQRAQWVTEQMGAHVVGITRF